MNLKVFLPLGLALLACAGAQAEKSAFEPCPDSFDEIWEIEDMHDQSADRLIDAVELDGITLPYDADTGTYYCPVGTDNGDEWPELKLTVSGEGDPRAIWIDRYTDDSCAQAVENGETYSFLAFTGESYAYYSVLFTGADLIDIHCDQDIEGEYVPCTVSIRSDDPEQNIDSAALVHLRGGGDLHETEKVSYRIEFHETEEKKKKVSVLGLPKDTDWILRANADASSVIHDPACWEVWNLWDQGEGRTQLHAKSVELFENDEYRGVYELLQRVDTKKEIRAAGGNLKTDVCIRVIHRHNPDEKYPRQDSVTMPESTYQIRYKPEDMTEEEAFSLIADYEKLNTLGEGAMDDEAFVSLMTKRFDIRELLDYYLFHSLCSLRNNVENNLYIWITFGEDGEYTYHLSPWDMDYSWDLNRSITTSFHYIDRLLDLGALDSWNILQELFSEKKARIIDTGALDNIFDTLRNEMQKSGAYLRETALWRGGAASPEIEMEYNDNLLDSIREILAMRMGK